MFVSCRRRNVRLSYPGVPGCYLEGRLGTRTLTVSVPIADIVVASSSLSTWGGFLSCGTKVYE